MAATSNLEAPPTAAGDQTLVLGAFVRVQRGLVAGGRPPAFDAESYKDRNTAERCFNKLKQHRAVATRYDKRAYTYQGTLAVVSIRTWLHDLTPRSPDSP